MQGRICSQWRRRDSNPHRRCARAASSRWTTSPRGGGPDGNRTRLDPARQAGGIPRCLRDQRGDHPDSNRDQEVHSLPCEPLHHGHHEAVRPRRIERRSAGYQPAALPLCYGQEMVWVAGIEPAAASFQARLSTNDLHPEKMVPVRDSNPRRPIESRPSCRWTNGARKQFRREDSNPDSRLQRPLSSR